MKVITMQGIGMRFVIAFLLVCLTWNPTRFCFTRWALNNWQELAPLVLFVGLCLLIGWVIFLRATARSLGALGIGLGVAIAASILWIIIRYNLIDPANSTTLAWVVLTLFSAILSAGMSWSHLRRRWSGQADMDDVDDDG